MEDEKQDCQPSPPDELDQRTQFFINELARMQQENERRFASMSRRMHDFEERTRGTSDELFDGKTMGILLLLTFAPVIVELIGTLVQKFRAKEIQQP